MITTNGTPEQREEMAYTTPDAVLTRPLHNAEALAFVATWEAMNVVDPNPAPYDRLSLRLMASENLTVADTIFLRELAEW